MFDSNENGLRVVGFPTVLEGELRLLGTFTPTELLVTGMVSCLIWLLLKDFGSTAIAVALVVFASLIVLKVMMPDEVGYYFPLYAAHFMLKRRSVYAHELDTTKYIPAMSFIDSWIMQLTNGVAVVVEVSPVNFFYSLPAEQRAYIDTYKNVLNSLDFPIQIMSIASEFDITRYMNRLVLRYRDEDVVMNPVLRDVLDDYINWLDTEISDVIQRRYFIIVSVPSGRSREAMTAELKRRAETLVMGLRRGNIQARILDRSEILALYELISCRENMPKNYNSAKVLVGGAGSGRQA